MKKGLQWPPPPPPPHAFIRILQFLKWNLFLWKNAFHHITFIRGRRRCRADGGSTSVCSQANPTQTAFPTTGLMLAQAQTFSCPGLLPSCSLQFSWSVQNSLAKLKATCYAAAVRSTNVFKSALCRFPLPENEPIRNSQSVQPGCGVQSNPNRTWAAWIFWCPLHFLAIQTEIDPYSKRTKLTVERHLGRRTCWW